MKGNKKQMKNTFLDVTNIYLIIKCIYWIRDMKTLAGVISRIYMQFPLKWDQTMLCVDNFYTS